MRVDGSSQLVQKLWNYCNIVRDDLSAPDCKLRSGRCGHTRAGGLLYLLAPGAQASGDYVEQLTFLLFLKVADGQISTAWKMVVNGAK